MIMQGQVAGRPLSRRVGDRGPGRVCPPAADRLVFAQWEPVAGGRSPVLATGAATTLTVLFVNPDVAPCGSWPTATGS
jgi:hypothetical protein